MKTRGRKLSFYTIPIYLDFSACQILIYIDFSVVHDLIRTVYEAPPPPLHGAMIIRFFVS